MCVCVCVCVCVSFVLFNALLLCLKGPVMSSMGKSKNWLLFFSAFRCLVASVLSDIISLLFLSMLLVGYVLCL